MDKGYVIDRYEIINYIGSGTFGNVFLCKEVGTDLVYAMKVQNKRKIDRFQIEHKTDSLMYAKIEQKILRQTDHPFIVRLKHSFQNTKNLFLILEYCPAGNLRRII